jgi:hypothetical protein
LHSRASSVILNDQSSLLGWDYGLVWFFRSGPASKKAMMVGLAGLDRTGPGAGGGGRRDERYVTGLWISNDESSFLDEVYGLVWFSFWASVKEAAVGWAGLEG